MVARPDLGSSGRADPDGSSGLSRLFSATGSGPTIPFAQWGQIGFLETAVVTCCGSDNVPNPGVWSAAGTSGQRLSRS